jgi:hypothetical protein
MTQIRVGIERNRRKEDHDRLLEGVSSFHGKVKRRIIEGALGTLHPVHNTSAAGIRSTRAAEGYARIRRELF